MDLFQQNEAQYAPIAALAFKAAGLPAALGPAIARQESGFILRSQNLTGRDRERGGAYGLCQMTLTTARGLGWHGTVEELLIPETNCHLAAELCSINSERLELPVASDAWVEDIASLYNSGHMLKNAPRLTSRYYVPNVLKYFRIYSVQYT